MDSACISFSTFHSPYLALKLHFPPFSLQQVNITTFPTPTFAHTPPYLLVQGAMKKLLALTAFYQCHTRQNRREIADSFYLPTRGRRAAVPALHAPMVPSVPAAGLPPSTPASCQLSLFIQL